MTVGSAELAHWLASRSRPRVAAGSGGRTAVIVLGYGSRSASLHPVQRWRTEIALRTLRTAGDGRLIFSGSAERQRSGRAEAEVMADHAVSVLGVAPDEVQLELDSASTWENVRCCLPLAESYDWITFASDPMHAARAARYAAVQRPDLAHRLVGAATYRPFERWWLKVPTAAYEAYVAVRYRGYRQWVGIRDHGGGTH